VLYMDDGNGVVFTQVYSDGTHTSTIVSNLTAGITYTFYVTALNFNGEGTASPTTSLVSCVAPSGVNAPIKISSTSSTVTLRWT
jgi:hypothetical protein